MSLERSMPSAEVRVAVRRLHLEDAVADVQNRNVERTAAEVVHRDLLVLLLVEPVRKRRRSRLVHNALHVKAGDLARVLRRLPLLVVEVGRNRDDRLGDLLAQKRLGVFLELPQHHRGYLLRGVHLVVHLHGRVAVGRGDDFVRNHLDFVCHLAVAPANEALDRVNRALRVRHRLALGRLADENLASFREGHYRRRSARTFLVRYNGGFATLHDSHAAVGRAKINSKYFCHFFILYFLRPP